MKKLKFQIRQLCKELERKNLSKERLMEIKIITLKIAELIDSQSDINYMVGIVDEIYRGDSKYPKRRIKKVIQLLMDYVNEKD